jgi:hypothetical protein
VPRGLVVSVAGWMEENGGWNGLPELFRGQWVLAMSVASIHFGREDCRELSIVG